ncbi:MAG: hypothetical protein ACI9IV_002137 [Paracoccaceae bacterium]|jgi:hypothetical protein|tara:strand:- start:44 stop:355 length:312 start_codon:yes stop_codon:yes gene_type:complete
MRIDIDIEVFGGTFASQPLVFAHLLDFADGLDLDHVEVICGVDPARRLAHHFDACVVADIEAALGVFGTCVLVFPQAVTKARVVQTALLKPLGTWRGHRHLAG